MGDILSLIEQHGKYLKRHEIRLAKIEEQNKTASAAADATQTLIDNTSADVSATNNKALLEAAVKVASKGELERLLLRICDTSEDATTKAMSVLPVDEARDTVASASATPAARPIVLQICDGSAVATTSEALSVLPVAEAYNAITGSSAVALAGSKRKAEGDEVVYRCNNCGKHFDADKLPPEDCRYHGGECVRNLPTLEFEELMISAVGEKKPNRYPDVPGRIERSCCYQTPEAVGCYTREHDVVMQRVALP